MKQKYKNHKEQSWAIVYPAFCHTVRYSMGDTGSSILDPRNGNSRDSMPLVLIASESKMHFSTQTKATLVQTEVSSSLEMQKAVNLVNIFVLFLIAEAEETLKNLASIVLATRAWSDWLRFDKKK